MTGAIATLLGLVPIWQTVKLEFPQFQAVTIGIDIAYYSVTSESMWTVILRKKRTSAGEGS